ncbi:MAG: TVP38/TMEM64 family protein [Peptoniphilus sp.]|uniref:TVP38/TMEM64 family protein n=1 Tax=Peptoniphilus sp. TaxID=1971214 RepID=UPI002A755B7C|nr:TVP38/TMEM64 family protein [Peptoniphilus sp.]MDY2986177.1 TVP38/TMEM64 family protein [Peptoniphilus sp.]
MKNLKNLTKIIISLLILIGSIFIIKIASFESLRNWVNEFGNSAPIVYILLYTILPIFFFPVPIFVLVAGILFGIWKGFIYTMIGCILNSTIMFYLGRFLGQDFFEKLILKIQTNLKKRLLHSEQKSLFYLFFILRLVPLVSYNLINYVAGFTKISYLNYIITTILGIIPGMLVFLNTGDKSLNTNSSEFIVSIFLLIALILVSTIFAKIYINRGNDDFDNNSNI